MALVVLLSLVLVGAGIMTIQGDFKVYSSISSSRDRIELWDDPMSKSEVVQRATTELSGIIGF